MINYYGYNTTLQETLHNLGLGYSLIYYRKLALPKIPIGGIGTCELPFNLEFFSDLYNLSYQDLSVTGDPSNDTIWEKYWTRVQYMISNDVPVRTSVNALQLSYYQDRYNLSDNITGGGHAIVIVGYNNSNNTICYNDPGVAIDDIPKNGTYVYESQDVFRKAVESRLINISTIQVFTKKPQFQLLSPQQRFEQSHAQNIKRLRGDFEAYYGIDPSNLPLLTYLYLSTYAYRGIAAARALKRDVSWPLHRLLTISRYQEYYNELSDIFYMMYDNTRIEKENISYYLLENQNLSPICKTEGLLFQREADCWKNFTLLVKELNEISANQGLIITFLQSQNIFKQMNQLLDEIINIEKTIIKINNNQGTHDCLRVASCS
jgi:hypothetical protein